MICELGYFICTQFPVGGQHWHELSPLFPVPNLFPQGTWTPITNLWWCVKGLDSVHSNTVGNAVCWLLAKTKKIMDVVQNGFNMIWNNCFDDFDPPQFDDIFLSLLMSGCSFLEFSGDKSDYFYQKKVNLQSFIIWEHFLQCSSTAKQFWNIIRPLEEGMIGLCVVLHSPSTNLEW